LELLAMTPPCCVEQGLEPLVCRKIYDNVGIRFLRMTNHRPADAARSFPQAGMRGKAQAGAEAHTLIFIRHPSSSGDQQILWFMKPANRLPADLGAPHQQLC